MCEKQVWCLLPRTLNNRQFRFSQFLANQFSAPKISDSLHLHGDFLIATPLSLGFLHLLHQLTHGCNHPFTLVLAASQKTTPDPTLVSFNWPCHVVRHFGQLLSSVSSCHYIMLHLIAPFNLSEGCLAHPSDLTSLWLFLIKDIPAGWIEGFIVTTWLFMGKKKSQCMLVTEISGSSVPRCVCKADVSLNLQPLKYFYKCDPPFFVGFSHNLARW